ncbi:hypothetical protein Pyn_12549 [Prunus yedoensis var. nudiflora]|uniref:Uncharacterized protein n=1 Tax=Prunus yedoensis var. nudiflora TaxID=2094558 RepID=A0A314XEV9_PRUYE|nr:hypothetical protein Pyn_12549 [Prunus yedoensis var. nudiflora]
MQLDEDFIRNSCRDHRQKKILLGCKEGWVAFGAWARGGRTRPNHDEPNHIQQMHKVNNVTTSTMEVQVEVVVLTKNLPAAKAMLFPKEQMMMLMMKFATVKR